MKKRLYFLLAFLPLLSGCNGLSRQGCSFLGLPAAPLIFLIAALITVGWSKIFREFRTNNKYRVPFLFCIAFSYCFGVIGCFLLDMHRKLSIEAIVQCMPGGVILCVVINVICFFLLLVPTVIYSLLIKLHFSKKYDKEHWYLVPRIVTAFYVISLALTAATGLTAFAALWVPLLLDPSQVQISPSPFHEFLRNAIVFLLDVPKVVSSFVISIIK